MLYGCAIVGKAREIIYPTGVSGEEETGGRGKKRNERGGHVVTLATGFLTVLIRAQIIVILTRALYVNPFYAERAISPVFQLGNWNGGRCASNRFIATL